MYISKLSLQGYRNCKSKSEINFNKSLNIIVGENASGKTSIINALRLILRENEFTYMNIIEDDFYKSFNDNKVVDSIKIDLEWSELSPDEQIIFLTWCDADFKAKLHLEVENKKNQKGYYKKAIWGGASKSSAFEEETFDCVDCIYLPPLRDAEEKLTNGHNSRLAALLGHEFENDNDKLKLQEMVKDFNQSIVKNEGNQFHQIEKAKNDINEKIKDSMGNVFGQSINLQFSDTTFSSILRSIKMVFFPELGQTNFDKFRDIAINSLGYNNLLYIATIFAELDAAGKEHNLFTILLIEEPEAHLHPQLQIKLIKYIESLTRTENNNIQVFVTTHSPVLASSVSIDNLIYIKNVNDTIISRQISLFQLEEENKNYINRWLDVTKSTLLFSKGIILVEGISEVMLIPELAKITLYKYNLNADIKLPKSLEEAGISVININGINFKYFFSLFCNIEEQMKSQTILKLPLRCSGITDNDPAKTETKDLNGNVQKLETYPTSPVKGNNSAIELISKISNSEFARLFVSPLKTFEYDLAMQNNTQIMSKTIKELWPTVGKITATCDIIIERQDNSTDKQILRDDSIFIYNHIDDDQIGKGVYAQTLADKIAKLYNAEIVKKQPDMDNIFKVPEYINKAIIWACGGVIKND